MVTYRKYGRTPPEDSAEALWARGEFVAAFASDWMIEFGRVYGVGPR